MNGSFYYLVSSLPLLRWGSRPALSSEDFLAHCEGQVPPDLLADLARVSLVPRDGAESAAEKGWGAWDTCMRNHVARARAHHLHRDANPALREETDAFPNDRKELDDALTQGNPLARERAIDHLRWRRLDELESGHLFDRDRLVVYRLKLLLLEKWSRFDAEVGARNLDELVAAGLLQAADERVTTD